jgi:MFS family permease
MPDMVPNEQRGHASGWLGLMSILGNIVGLVLGGLGLSRAHADDLLTAQQQITVYGIMIAMLVVFLGITVFGVREKPLAPTGRKDSLGTMLRELWISPREYPDFAWVWVTRFLVTMGFNTVQFYLLYFLQDVVGVSRDAIAGHASIMYLGLLLSGAVSSIIGGRISDQKGRKPLIYFAGGLMSVAGVLFILYILLGAAPMPGLFEGAFNTVVYIGIGFGIGYGTYQSVDWALGTDVLPNKETGAAAAMGVWHISFVLPQTLATVFAGSLLTGTANAGMAPGPRYALVFGMSIIYFILGTVFVRKVKGAR